mgnify:CR=1 FL=1
MLAASPTPDGIQLQLTGNADLFEQELIAALKILQAGDTSPARMVGRASPRRSR